MFCFLPAIHSYTIYRYTVYSITSSSFFCTGYSSRIGRNSLKFDQPRPGEGGRRGIGAGSDGRNRNGLRRRGLTWQKSPKLWWLLVKMKDCKPRILMNIFDFWWLQFVALDFISPVGLLIGRLWCLNPQHVRQLASDASVLQRKKV